MTIQSGKGNAQGGGNHHVHQYRHDGRSCRLGPKQSHQQRYPHETSVGKGSHQRTKGSIIPANATMQSNRHHKANHDQGAQQVGQRHTRVQQLGNRGAGAKPVQHARQCKKQHKGVQTGNGWHGQHATVGRDKATQDQGEKGKGDDENVQHISIVGSFPPPGCHPLRWRACPQVLPECLLPPLLLLPCPTASTWHNRRQ